MLYNRPNIATYYHDIPTLLLTHARRYWLFINQKLSIWRHNKHHLFLFYYNRDYASSPKGQAGASNTTTSLGIER